MWGVVMFNFLGARVYRAKVLRRIEQQMIQHLGREQGREAAGAFAAAALNSDIGTDFMERLRKADLSVEDAAIAYFDASITAIKRALASRDEPDLQRLIRNMESGLDLMFLAHPGMIVPRNGNAGPSLAEFTDE